MNNQYMPTAQDFVATTTATVAGATRTNPLLDSAGCKLPVASVVQQLQRNIMTGTGDTYCESGDTFTSGVSIRLFGLLGTEINLMPMLSGSFTNHTDNVNASGLAEHLTNQVLAGEEMLAVKYVFKLDDAITDTTIYSNRPDYDNGPATEVTDVPSWMKVSQKRTPKAGVIAYLNVYILKGDELVNICRQDIRKDCARTIAQIKQGVKAGVQFTAKAYPTGDVLGWLSAPEATVVPQTAKPATDFSAFKTEE